MVSISASKTAKWEISWLTEDPPVEDIAWSSVFYIPQGNPNISFFSSSFQLFVKRFLKVSLGYKSLLGHK